ncbi:MAG: hypothetical protein IKA00_03185 [Prevotella sp.]|nr:hypothetical protein [Prevotella sp.]
MNDGSGYKLNRDQLLLDLYVAFYDARQHKAKMSYVRKFEAHLKKNMDELCDDLLTRRYTARPSKCFRDRVPEEERSVRGYVPRPCCAPSLLQLLPRAL